MTLFRRTRVLVSATLHDWFDRLERPDQMARHSLRELATAIESATAAAARSIAAERWLVRQGDELPGRLDAWERLAADAVRRGDETAARESLSRKFDIVQNAARLDRQIAEAANVNRGLRTQLDTMRDRYARAETQLALAGVRQAVAEASRQVGGVALSPMTLDRALDQVERTTLEAEVRGELSSDLTPPSDREREQFVRDELARLKGSG